jgi:hypothetical protein
MYGVVLAIHNILRWVVLLSGVVILVTSITGLLRNREYGGTERTLSIVYTSSLDLQLLLGLLLYIFLSPITRTAFADFSAAMSNSDLRFFAIEHLLVMIVAIVVGHIGSSRVKKADGNLKKHRSGLLWFGISLLLVLLAVPWERALFPGL